MKNKRTCDYIAEAIQNEILSGRMEAGQPLRQEELSEKLGYSRMPVREALQILEESWCWSSRASFSMPRRSTCWRALATP